MSSTKKKVLTSLVSLVVVVVAAVVAFTAVWAARNTSVNSGFTITYTAMNVKATISGTYQTNDAASPTALAPASITFDGTEATNGSANVKSFTSVTPVLKESGSTAYVDFVYTITNDAGATNNIDIALASDPDTASNNLTYTYSASVSGGSTATTGTTYSNLVSGLEAGKTATITIRATVDDLDTNVNASGTFAFVLTGVSA